MTQTNRRRILAFLIADTCLVLIGIAIFSGGASATTDSAWEDVGHMNLYSLVRSDTGTARSSTPMKKYACPQCGSAIDWASEACPQCGWCPARLMNQAAFPCVRTGPFAGEAGANTAPRRPDAAMVPVGGGTEATAVPRQQAALQAAATVPTTTLPTPREQDAAGRHDSRQRVGTFGIEEEVRAGGRAAYDGDAQRHRLRGAQSGQRDLERDRSPGGVDLITSGSDVRFVLLGAKSVGQETLNRFYVLHCVGLPLVAAFLIGLHFWRIRKDGGLSHPEDVGNPGLETKD